IRDNDLLQAFKFLRKQFVLAKLVIHESRNIERVSSALVNDSVFKLNHRYLIISAIRKLQNLTALPARNLASFKLLPNSDECLGDRNAVGTICKLVNNRLGHLLIRKQKLRLAPIFSC